MQHRLRFLGVLAVVVGLAFPLAAQVDPELLAGMRARAVGPGGMSGRIAAIEAVESNPDIIYVGAATGGVWKSENGGLTWTPIFDEQPVASIGAVAIFQANPDIIWVGTGEGNTRNSTSVGNGVYQSLDAGRTWTHLGLEETERIHRVLLHPTDPRVAYVCALGKLWGENPERGVFQTTDGGRNWQKILYVDEKTGCADLAMDPSNPQKLIASMWQHRRWPWFFRSGGPGSGLYLSVDSGQNWRKLTEDDGLPPRPWGRIGVAFFRENPQIIYALVEAEKNVLLRSEDGGQNWEKVNEETNVAPRPFYYADLRVDPERPNRVYNLHGRLTVSDDGGENFETLAPFSHVHPDHHALWINPHDGSHLIDGNDGGVYLSRDRGQSWQFVSNLPLAQYYHISVDTDTPYHILGGMQDNGSWRGPAYVWENGGIRNHHWEEVGFGDGFDVIAHPDDSLVGYAMSQEGYLIRWNLRTGERKDIRPSSPEGVKLRFNWNAALAQDPFDSDTLYYGSQFVHKSTDRGDTWTLISPDLTTNNPDWQKQDESGGLTPDVTGAENFTAIIALAPSPLQPGVLWVGTDDGRLQVTRDAGQNWESVQRNVPGVPPHTWVPHIEPSKFDAGTAFVVFDDHRRSNWTPYIFKTTNYGRDWVSLATEDIRGYALVIEQDPVEKDLLFLGTEFGLYVSLDGGGRWFRWTHGIPTVGVRDLVVHPREHDLVIGTHGRAAYVIDNIRPLRALSGEIQRESIHLFGIPDAQQYMVKQTGESRFPGHGEFRGQNRPYGALLTYWLNFEGLPHPQEEVERRRKEEERQRELAEREEAEEKAEGEEKEEEGPEVEIQIADAEGNVIRTFRQPAVLGLNRTVWNLRRDPFPHPREEEPPPWRVPRWLEGLPGTYTVTLKYDDQEAQGRVRVLADPRYEIPRADREAKRTAIQRAGHLQKLVAEGVERIRSARADIEAAMKKVKEVQEESEIEASEAQEFLASGKKLREALDEMERRLWVPPNVKGIVAETDALSKISHVLNSLGSSWHAPTPAQLEYLERANEHLGTVLEDFNLLFESQVSDFRQRVEDLGIELLPEKEPLTLQAE